MPEQETRQPLVTGLAEMVRFQRRSPATLSRGVLHNARNADAFPARPRQVKHLNRMGINHHTRLTRDRNRSIAFRARCRGIDMQCSTAITGVGE